MTDYLTIVASVAFSDASGTPINGMLTVTPSSMSRVGGGGQADDQPIVRRLVNGLISTPLTLANPAYTSPEGIGYTFVISNGRTSSTFVNVLIQDDGTGQWDIAQLNTGQFVVAVPQTVISVSGATGSSNTVIETAATTISQYQMVAVINGQASTADSTNLAQIGAVVGVATQSVQAGTSLPIQYAGTITNSAWSFTPGPVFLGLNGQITQTLPATGYLQVVGTAITPSSVLISVQPPIRLS